MVHGSSTGSGTQVEHVGNIVTTARIRMTGTTQA